jgi:hypothetical protein
MLISLKIVNTNFLILFDMTAKTDTSLLFFIPILTFFILFQLYVGLTSAQLPHFINFLWHSSRAA